MKKFQNHGVVTTITLCLSSPTPQLVYDKYIISP